MRAGGSENAIPKPACQGPGPPQYRRIPAFRLAAMTGWWDGIMAAGLAVLCACSSAAAQQPPVTATPCGGDIIAQTTVGRVIDGRTFVLDDGREVRLAAIETPSMASPQDAEAAPGGDAARDALSALAGGDEVVLRRAEAAADRYRRVLAYAYTVRDGTEFFTQGELISSGFARVGDQIGSRSCAAELLARENAARRAKLGLWANSYYDVLDAETPADVLARRGRFALVEGRVVSVRESGATIYVNFGQRWSEDFTVTVSKRNERNFKAAGLDLAGLAGRRVRVRGWVEQRGGPGGSPWIEAAHPEQIETANLK
jgi:endonuclease YncB( thermonuclease family)